jgi:hypothetical protein
MAKNKVIHAAVFCLFISTLPACGGGSSDSASSQHSCTLPCLESTPTLDTSSITSASGGTVRATFTLRGDISNISDVAVFLIPTDIMSTNPAAGSGWLFNPTTATNYVDITIDSGTTIGDYYPTVIIRPITAPSNSRSQYYFDPYMSSSNYIYTEVNTGLIPVVTNFSIPVLHVQ